MSSNRKLQALHTKLNKLVSQRQAARRRLRTEQEKIQKLEWQIEQTTREINDITGGFDY
jgi:peptidoglycan hydrolase CwlO-like protein